MRKRILSIAGGMLSRGCESMHARILSILLLALCAGPLRSAPAPAPPPAETPAEASARALRADLDRIFADADLSRTVVAARVLSLGPKGGEPRVLYSLRADRPLVPASTTKLVTTAACWDRLGPDWRIRTRVGRIPAEKKGAPPDLVVLGGGDPNFSGRFYADDPVGAFRQWARVLKARGLTAFGRILLDDRLFEAEVVHPHWPADQRQEWYEAPAGAVNLNDNCVDVCLAPGKAGEAALVRLVPATAYIALDNQIRTVSEKGGHRYSLVREILGLGLPGMRIRAVGAYWTGAAPAVQNVAVADPTLYFGSALLETLRAEGLRVAGPALRAAVVTPEGVPEGFTCDLVHASRLDATIAVANKRSQGMYAECLLKLLGAFASNPGAEYGSASAARRPRLASWNTGRAEAMRWLADRGIPADGLVLDDGSGLSKENRLTALAVTELLRVMVERHGEAFIGTLAVAGRDGSLRSRMRNTAAEGNVYGKTGYVAGTSALSGCVRTRAGRWIVFSILMNDVPWGELWRARLAQDKVCIRLVDYE